MKGKDFHAFFWYVLLKFSQDLSSPFVVIEHVFTPDFR